MRRQLALATLLLLMQAASATQLAELAKREAGKADKALRDEDKQQRKDEKDDTAGKRAATFGLAGESAQQKMQRLFDEAHAAAPNKWYQAAKVEDITPPGDDARKIYKITGMLGSYCVRYADKNRADQGKANPGEPLIGACPHMFKGL
ncbi:hypothetical protein Q4S45_16575 [Massilia sp. R2A-15]|uniref:hypothetical protein n=1 Tax=Massilia sp. R2A-15 TaxID=3064278 RepID=UPI0027347AD6|nr:hypothetical protein [Massilia sp. R2A-15]WLI88336.1 hypothetical protein Q4S45_16575 [Massilia sp. R2A-15]